MEGVYSIFGAFLNSIWFKLIVIALSITIAYFILRTIYRKMCKRLINVISYRREFSSSGVYEGEYVTLTEIIHNTSPFPLLFVDIEGYLYNNLRLTEYDFDPSKGMQLFVSRFKLMLPYMQVKRRHEVKCIKRGHYALESVKMVVSSSERFIDSTAEIYVYPRLLEPPTHPSPVSAMQGETYSKRWLMKDPFSISGIRDYVPGDPFNSVNFKATARTGGFFTGQLKVNNRDYCANRTIAVFINFSISHDEPIPGDIYEYKMEKYLAYAAMILRDATYKGYRCGLWANAKTEDGHTYVKFPIAGGNLQLHEMMRSMSCMRLSPGMSFGGLINNEIVGKLCDTEVYVLSLYADDTINERLHTLSLMGNSVNLIVDEEDISDE